MELSFQVLLIQIQYAGRRKQKLFPIAHGGFGDLTSTTMRLKIVTTSKGSTTRPETNRECSVVAARANVSPTLASKRAVFRSASSSCRDFGLGGSAELIGLLRVKFIRRNAASIVLNDCDHYTAASSIEQV
jgi:hypothetical protein